MSDRAIGFVLSIALVPFLGIGCGSGAPSIVERQAWKANSRDVVSIAFSPDGKNIASRGGDAVKVWDVARGAEVASFPLDGAEFGSVVFSPDGKAVATNRREGGAVAWELGEDRRSTTYAFPAASIKPTTAPPTPGWGLAYSPDGKSLAVGGSHNGECGFLSTWDVGTGAGVALKPIARPITTVAYSPDGKTIATGSMDGQVVLWDPAGKSERLRIDAKRSYLAPVCFSPDSKWLATTDEARWVRIWDVATGKPIATLKGHLKAVLSLAFSPDGRILVSGDSAATLFVWDLSKRKARSIVESKDRGKVWGLAFSPDGKTLASSGEDRLIHLWDVLGP